MGTTPYDSCGTSKKEERRKNEKIFILPMDIWTQYLRGRNMTLYFVFVLSTAGGKTQLPQSKREMAMKMSHTNYLSCPCCADISLACWLTTSKSDVCRCQFRWIEQHIIYCHMASTISSHSKVYTRAKWTICSWQHPFPAPCRCCASASYNIHTLLFQRDLCMKHAKNHTTHKDDMSSLLLTTPISHTM